MKRVDTTMLYYHDLHLPYSRYLADGLVALDSGLLLLGPRPKAENPIFTQGSHATVTEQIREIESVRSNWKWFSAVSFFKELVARRPRNIIVLDEPMSRNVLVAAVLAFMSSLGGTRVYFYSFENLSQRPLFSNLPSWPAFVSAMRKLLRFALFDVLLMPFRMLLIRGGCYSYFECKTVVNKKLWYPRMRECWFPIDSECFSHERNLVLGSEIRRQYGLEREAKVVGFVGRLVEQKGVDTLVRAISRMESSVRLVVVGSGPEESRLRALAESLGCGERVIWVGAQSGHGVWRHFQMMDLLVLPSKSTPYWKEQLGRILIEATCAGVPVCGSSSGAIPFVVDNRLRVFVEGSDLDCARVLERNLALGSDALRVAEYRSRASVRSFYDAFRELF